MYLVVSISNERDNTDEITFKSNISMFATNLGYDNSNEASCILESQSIDKCSS